MTVFSHVGQCVRDLDATRAYYVEVLDFEEVMHLDISGAPSATLLRLPEPVNAEAVYLRRDGFVLELLSFTDPSPEARRERPIVEPGLTHSSFGVEDLDAACAAVVEHGGTVFEA